jgi:oxygen-independent coproporphyrinogen-3 oxidase
VNYWRSGDYLGLGAGAHSYRRNPDGITGQRWNNEKSPAKYMAQIDEIQRAIVDRETIDLRQAAAEFMFLGLRMTEGIRTDIFRQRFGQTPREFYPQIDTWIDGALLVENGGFLRFTTKGLMLANSIFVHFM